MIKRYTWVAILAALGCSPRESVVSEEQSGFCLSESLRSKLVVDTLSSREVTQHVTLTGEVSYHPDQVVQFASLVEGVVVQADFALGDYVKQGQVLATLKSPELHTMVAEKRALESELRLASREYDAKKRLYEDELAAEKDLIGAETAVARIEAELANLSANLELFRPADQGTFALRAPASGYIVEKNINPGMPITEGSHLFTVSGLGQVWVMANVYATDVQFVQQGMAVEIRTLSYPDEVFHGKISALPQVFDQTERVLKARIVIDNDGLKLKPGMSADIAVERRSGQQAVALPADAVIFDDNQYFVVVYRGDCDLQVRPISFITRDNQWYFVSEGLQAGEVVVTQDHLLIYERVNR